MLFICLIAKTLRVVFLDRSTDHAFNLAESTTLARQRKITTLGEIYKGCGFSTGPGSSD